MEKFDKTASKPSLIILIVIDTLRADRMSCYGYRLKTTPFLDSVLSDFVKFEWAFSSCSYTLPSITSILTGKYPAEHSLGVYQTSYLIERKLDSNRDIMIQEVLKSYGYETYAIFSAPVLNVSVGIGKGFDKVYESFDRRPYYQTTQIAQNILKKKAKNLFLFIHYFDVHVPYEYGYKNIKFTTNEYKNIYLKKGITIPYDVTLDNNLNSNIYEASYDSSIYIVDNELGKIIDTLKEEKIYEESLIIITADHGELMGEEGLFCYHMINLHPALLHIPLLIKFPQPVKSLDVSKPVSNISIYSLIKNLIALNGDKNYTWYKTNSYPLIANHYFFNALIDEDRVVRVYPQQFYYLLVGSHKNIKDVIVYRYDGIRKKWFTQKDNIPVSSETITIKNARFRQDMIFLHIYWNITERLKNVLQRLHVFSIVRTIYIRYIAPFLRRILTKNKLK